MKVQKKSPGRPKFGSVGKSLGKRYDLYLTADLAAHVEGRTSDTATAYIRDLVRADFDRLKKKFQK